MHVYPIILYMGGLHVSLKKKSQKGKYFVIIHRYLSIPSIIYLNVTRKPCSHIFV